MIRKLWTLLLIVLMMVGMMAVMVNADPGPSDEENVIPYPIITANISTPFM